MNEPNFIWVFPDFPIFPIIHRLLHHYMTVRGSSFNEVLDRVRLWIRDPGFTKSPAFKRMAGLAKAERMAKAMNVSCGDRGQIDALFIALHVPSQSYNSHYMTASCL
jgi:hypothetical protein